MTKRILHILSILLAAFLLSGVAAVAQDTRKQENRKASLQKEIRKINDQLRDNKNKQSSQMQNIRLLGRKIDARNALVAENEAEIRELADSIRLTTGEISALSARLDTLEDHYSRMVRTAYRSRDRKTWFLYIFGSRNISQGVRRFIYLKHISQSLSESARQVQETRTHLEAERVRLDSLSQRTQQRKKAIESEVTALGRERAQSEQMVASLQKDRDKYLAQLNKKKKEVEALNREIAAIIRKAAEKAAAKNAGKSSSGSTSGTSSTTAPSGKAVSTDADPALSGQFAANKGRLPWPVDGVVLESFGQHTHPVYKNVQLPFNNGVTVSTRAGVPVKAVYDGEVGQVIVMPGYNQCVLVQHGKYMTLYCCMTGVSVKQGDKVKTGQPLGTVCSIDGESKMHFELWQERSPQNPELWLK
ncbi:MAG: peptidoglycan DD-metalloendopeptidase family protein [Bacteroidales bacterium]|nr:peptidoglycan DD-metalloendopeptidase family protein [Bacteroidales bacterium]